MAPQNNRNNNEDLNTIIQTLIAPLVAQLKELDGKVDKLNENYVTRSDLEKMIISLVPKELYEARHTALIAQDIQLEEKIKDVRIDMQTSQQKLHDRLESGKQQFEERLKEQSATLLSNKDRTWIRWTQVASGAALLATILEIFAQHIKFN